MICENTYIYPDMYLIAWVYTYIHTYNQLSLRIHKKLLLVVALEKEKERLEKAGRKTYFFTVYP